MNSYFAKLNEFLFSCLADMSARPIVTFMISCSYFEVQYLFDLIYLFPASDSNIYMINNTRHKKMGSKALTCAWPQ